MELDVEFEFFESQKEEWLRYYRGQYALIKGRKLLGTYTTWEQAFDAGVQQLGNVPMLIKQVTEKPEVAYFPTLATGALSARP